MSITVKFFFKAKRVPMPVPVFPGGKSIPAVDLALFFSTGMTVQRSELHS